MEQGRSVNCHVCNIEVDQNNAYEWQGVYDRQGRFSHNYVCPKCMADACLAHGLTQEAMDIHQKHCTGCSFCERGD